MEQRMSPFLYFHVFLASVIFAENVALKILQWRDHWKLNVTWINDNNATSRRISIHIVHNQVVPEPDNDNLNNLNNNSNNSMDNLVSFQMNWMFIGILIFGVLYSVRFVMGLMFPE